LRYPGRGTRMKGPSSDRTIKQMGKPLPLEVGLTDQMELDGIGHVKNILAISAPPSHVYKASVVATSNSTINLQLVHHASGLFPSLPPSIHANVFDNAANWKLRDGLPNRTNKRILRKLMRVHQQ
jgi:hypothetical protein